MAVVQNKALENGDVLIIKTDVPLIGIVALLSFVDSTQGESGAKYFDKKFKYSVDGVNWSPYLPLDNTTISQIQVSPNDTLFIEYRYERVGTSNTGELQWDSTTIYGEFLDTDLGQDWENSPFSGNIDYAGVCSIGWSVNVLEKLYKRGLLPKYIERGENNSNDEDRDFIDFWRAITHYFGLYVCLARYYRSFYTNPNLLREYLKQHNIFTNQNSTLQELTYLMEHRLAELAKRGTLNIFLDKLHELNLSTKQVDGEFLRLIDYNEHDELLFSINNPENDGWWVNQCSPEYYGFSQSEWFNKYPQKTNQPLDLNNINYTGNVSIVTINNEEYFRVNNGVVGKKDFTKSIKINPNLGYIFSFYIMPELPPPSIDVGIHCFTENGVIQTAANPKTLQSTNIAIDNYQVTKPQYIKILLLPSERVSTYNIANSYDKNDIVKSGNDFYVALSNIPQNTSLTSPLWYQLTQSDIKWIFEPVKNNNNLQFTDTIKYIVPYISVVGIANIKDIQLRPFNIEKGRGFIQCGGVIEVICTNNSLDYSNDKVDKLSKKYLLPTNKLLLTHYI